MKLQIKSNPTSTNYTVQQLIKDLLNCKNLDALVFGFNLDTGDRFAIHSIDDSFENNRCIDINFTENLGGEK